MTVATHLCSHIILKFGFPRKLHSDNGMEFKSKLIEHLSQQLDIKANGKLESSYRFINDCI